jgi:hypothetical protein
VLTTERLVRSLRRTLFGAAALCTLASCTPSPRAAAKRAAQDRVGKRVEDTALKRAMDEAIDPANLAQDRALLRRVIGMPWREIAARLNRPLSWQGRGLVRYGVAGGRELALDEEATLRFAPDPEALDLTVTNDSGFHQRLIFSNGVLYQKYNNGSFHARKDLEGIRSDRGDEALGLVTAPLSLVFERLEAADREAATVADRKAFCYRLRLGPAQAVGPTPKAAAQVGALGDLVAWRRSLQVTDLKGRLCVDRTRAVPLFIEVEANGLRGRGDAGAQGKLFLHLKGEVLSTDKPPAIAAPTEYLKALKRRRRTRPALEPLRRGGLPVAAPERHDAG